jgi:hypothetical protein
MLPILPIPYPGESGASFLIRTASANIHASVTHLLSHRYKLRKKSKMHLISDIHDYHSFNILTALLDIDEEITENLVLKYCNQTLFCGLIFNGFIFPNGLFRSDGIGYCPKCLRDEQFLHNSWRFIPYYACLKHKAIILTECPNCQKTLNPLRGSVVHCHRCKYDLSTAKDTLVNIDSLLYFSELFIKHGQSAVDDFSYLWSSLCTLRKKNDINIDNLSMMGIIYAAFDRPNEAASIFIDITNSTSYDLFELSGYETFSKENIISKRFFTSITSKFSALKFSKYLCKVKLTKKQTCELLNISYPKLLTSIKNGAILWPQSNKRGAKIDADKIYKILENPELLNCKTPSYSKDFISSEYGYYTIKDASELLSVHPEIIRSLIHTSWLKSEKKRILGSSRYVINSEDMDQFNEKYVCVGTIAKKRKINPTNLAEKLATLNIYPVDGPHIQGLKTTLFHRSDVEKISNDQIHEILSYPTKVGRKRNGQYTIIPQPPKQCYNLKEAAQLLNISFQKVAVLVRKGILATEYNPPLLYVKTPAIQNLSHIIFGGGFITVEKASQIAECTSAWIYINFINKGIVTLVDCVYWKMISIDDFKLIQDIRKDYFTSTEASLHLGMHRLHINNLKKLGKIRPIHIDPNCKLDLYSKKRIEEMKSNNLYYPQDKS